MAAIGRRGRPFEAWPGYVDVLSTLLMVIIFVLMVFIIAQFFLSSALSGKDEALDRLNLQIAELGQLLALERSQSADLRLDLSGLSSELEKATAERDEMNRRLTVVLGERDTTAKQLAELQLSLSGAGAATAKVEGELAEAYKAIEADRAKIEALLGDIAALESLRDEMAAKLLTGESEAADARDAWTQKLAEAEQKATQEKTLRDRASEEAALRIEILNRQMASLRQQLARLADALDISESKAREQDVQIIDLGKRLNAALANKVEELARYRSEFFGRLREVLGERPDIQIVGDRFVFQSEVLFESASAEIGPAGREQLAQFAATLREIAAKIPEDIDWLLRVDGHTDRRPIQTPLFPSNWELSTARAIAVVRFLVGEGVPANRLVAAGFAQFRPLDEGEDEGALRRNRRIEMKLDQR
jgi:chemotaxis protein MotB